MVSLTKCVSKAKLHWPSAKFIPDTTSKSNCFIATAVYGTDSVEVLTLRAFRTQWLSSGKMGRVFITLYERLSPHFAVMLVKYPLLRTLAQWFIVTPVFWVTKQFTRLDNKNVT